MTQTAIPQWARGLEGQVALVTGAGRGLGRACALALSEAGAEIVGVARTEAELVSLSEEAPGPGAVPTPSGASFGSWL